MKRPVLISILACFLICTNFYCKRVDVPEGVPSCIKKEIKKSDACLEKVTEYNYQESSVFLFENNNCPDALSFIYDDNCNCICSPSGGITGQGDKKCTDFFETATKVRIIWSKN